MKKKEACKIIIIIILSLCIIGINEQESLDEKHQVPKVQTNAEVPDLIRRTITEVSGIQSYIERGPIEITTDFQLNSSGFPGIGTNDDPIRIEGYNITASSTNLIMISHTTYHFIIINCLLNGQTSDLWGIVFDNVTNSRVENNRIMNTGIDGIGIYNSKHNTIINNTIFNAAATGVRLELYSNYNIITNNTLFDNGDGIKVINYSNNNSIINNSIFNSGLGIWLGTDGSPPPTGSANNTIIENTIHDNLYAGIRLTDNSESNKVHNNTLYRNDAYGGISLEKSNNNTITSNVLFNNNVGIRNQNSSHILIEANIVYNNTWHGIFCKNINYTRVFKNIIYNSNTSGIFLRDGHHATIKENICYKNSLIFQPIDADYQSGGITIIVSQSIISNNSVFENNDNGIILYWANNNNISTNIIKGNRRHGISVGESNDNYFEGNQILENERTGILLGYLSSRSFFFRNLILNNKDWGIKIFPDSHKNTFNQNDFLNNNMNGAHVIDNGTENDFLGNYWGDWYGEVYSINGTAETRDHFPLLNPFHISQPDIIAPIREEIEPVLSGNVVFQWNVSKDTFGHSLKYSILYTSNEGTTWTILISGLTTTNYTLDTTIIEESIRIQFKVQVYDTYGFITNSLPTQIFQIMNELGPPKIIFPNGGENLKGMVNIVWEESFDPFNHSVTYTIYYSINNGALWTKLADGITTTNYLWNTTKMPNGLSYLIKIVATCTAGITTEDVSDTVFTIENYISTTTKTIDDIPGLTGMVLLGALMMIVNVRKKKY